MSWRIDVATPYGGRLCRHWKEWEAERFDKDEEIEIEKEGQCGVVKKPRTKNHPKAWRCHSTSFYIQLSFTYASKLILP